jgi:hypothetical protein
VELGEDLIGVLGPAKRLTVLIPAVAEPTDHRNQLLNTGEVAAAQRLAIDDGKEHLDQVQLGSIGRGELQLHAGMLGRPDLDPLGACGWRSCPLQHAAVGAGRPLRPA